MNQRFSAVMFDLDGTLADSLADIAAAGNHVLEYFGQPAKPIADYRYLAGQGAEWLVREALGPGFDAKIPEAMSVFKEFQLKHAHAKTTLYPGIAAMLRALTREKYKLAVLSNKPDKATVQLVSSLLSEWQFDVVRGHREGVGLKPDPASALAITEELNIPPHRWAYLGDTMVDMQTARGAGMFAVGVLWGFRDEKELRDSGAQAIIAQPMDFMKLLWE